MLDKSVTIEDLIDSMEKDDIRRNKYLTKFIRILCNNGFNHFYSLDGEWGSGKTIFIEKICLLINYYSFYENGEKIDNNGYINNCFELDTSVIEKMEKLTEKREFYSIKEMVKNNCINAIYFNAWEHDDEEDPILSIIFEIIYEYHLIDSTKIIEKGSILDTVKGLIKLLSIGKLDVDGLLNEENLTKRIELKNQIKKSVNTTLNDIINENCEKLVIFIDELDRCKPDYAIALLEKINHYIDDDRVIVVLSTNIKELVHTISTKYGNEFSSEKYLDKFIDEHLYLPKVNTDQYLSTLVTSYNFERNTWNSIVIKHFVDYKKIEMREISHYIGCMNHFEKYFCENELMMSEHSKMVKYVFLPYMAGLYCVSPLEYNSFIKGNGFSELELFIKTNKQITEICKRFLYDIEVNDDIFFADLKKLYDLIFGNNKTIKVRIGRVDILKSEFNELQDTILLLGDLSEFK